MRAHLTSAKLAGRSATRAPPNKGAVVYEVILARAVQNSGWLRVRRSWGSEMVKQRERTKGQPRKQQVGIWLLGYYYGGRRNMETRASCAAGSAGSSSAPSIRSGQAALCGPYMYLSAPR